MGQLTLIMPAVSEAPEPTLKQTRRFSLSEELQDAFRPQPINPKRYPYRFGVVFKDVPEPLGGLTKETAKMLFDKHADARQLVEGVLGWGIVDLEGATVLERRDH